MNVTASIVAWRVNECGIVLDTPEEEVGWTGRQ